MTTHGRSATFSRLLYQTPVAELCHPRATVAEGFDAAFSVLRRAGQRDEYVYRAALTQKLLMGKHSLNTASMLTEFRAGTCKADLVILNGTATAYEIKSERDSLIRIENQLANYRKVFATVNVIVSESHVDSVVATTPQDVGVMSLSGRYQIQTVRDALAQPERVCPRTIFESLRSEEAKMVLNTLDVASPDVPNTRLRTTLRSIFEKQDASAVHAAMVETLKRTRSLASLAKFVKKLPWSLHALALGTKPRANEQERLIQALSTRLTDTRHW